MREETDALEAIQALGYSLKDARDALARIRTENSDGQSPSPQTAKEKIREALKILGGG